MRSRLLKHHAAGGQTTFSTMQLPKMNLTQRKALGTKLTSDVSFVSDVQRDLFIIQLESLLDANCDESGTCKVPVAEAITSIETEFENFNAFKAGGKDETYDDLDSIDYSSDEDENGVVNVSSDPNFVHFALSTAVLSSALKYGGGINLRLREAAVFFSSLTKDQVDNQDTSKWTLHTYVERFSRLDELESLTTTPFMLKICTIILLQLGELEATPAR